MRIALAGLLSLVGCPRSGDSEADSSVTVNPCPIGAPDVDGDGIQGCAGDCNDTDAGVHPGAAEHCDGIDNNCDGEIPGELDADGDGWRVCDGDCADDDPQLHPGAPELCADAGVDDDCDGNETEVAWDASDLVTLYEDDDEDGYGRSNSMIPSCDEAGYPGWAPLAGDCDDDDPNVSPGAFDRCLDGVDTNCDGRDSTCPDTWLAAARLKTRIAGENVDARIGWTAVTTVEGTSPTIWVPTTYPTGRNEIRVVALAGDVPMTDGEPVATIAGSVVTPLGGDYTGDGVEDLVVGDPDDEDGVGVAFIYSGVTSGKVASEEAALRITSDGGELRMGSMVASAGDIDGSGELDVLLGGRIANRTGSNRSNRSAAVWLLFDPAAPEVSIDDAELVVFRDYENGLDSLEVADVGDLDGDGVGDILVGDRYSDCGGDSSGIVFLISGALRGFKKISLPDVAAICPDSKERLGTSVAVTPDLDGDGYRDAVVGGPHYGEEVPGRVLFLGGGPVLGDILRNQVGTIIGEPGSGLGASVASTGDMDGDGADDVLVGVTEDIVGGAVLVFSGPQPGTVTLGDERRRWLGATPGDQLGASISPAGDLTGDGVPDVWLGAPSVDTPAPDGGVLYLATED